MDFPSNSVRLVFAGSPLLDISAKCNAETLVRYGLKPDDCVKATERHDELLQSLFKDPESQLSAGGSAQNSARIAKWVLGNKGEVSFIGCIGDDIYGNWMKRTLESEDVNPLYIRVPEKKTGVCVCLLTEQGCRSMITQQGAAAEISAKHLNLEDIKSVLSEASHVFIVGYLLSHSAEFVHKLADNCSEKQILSLSLSAEYICKEYTKEIVKVMPRVDFLFGNEHEVVAFAEALSGQQSLTVTKALSVVSELKRYSSARPRIVVVTRGSESVIVDDGSGVIRSFDVPRNVTVVDSVGCGDALAGAFVATFALSNSLDISVKAGIRAASEVSQMNGCYPPSRKYEF